MTHTLTDSDFAWALIIAIGLYGLIAWLFFKMGYEKCMIDHRDKEIEENQKKEALRRDKLKG